MILWSHVQRLLISIFTGFYLIYLIIPLCFKKANHCHVDLNWLVIDLLFSTCVEWCLGFFFFYTGLVWMCGKWLPSLPTFWKMWTSVMSSYTRTRERVGLPILCSVLWPISIRKDLLNLKIHQNILFFRLFLIFFIEHITHVIL